MHEIFDIVIVGAGIGGLATAYYLKQEAGLSDLRILVLESSSTAGGRLLRQRFTGGGVALDMGAGRFCNKSHRRVAELARKFDLKTKPFQYQTQFGIEDSHAQGLFFASSLFAIQEAFSRGMYCMGSFRDAAIAVLGAEAAQNFFAWAGYDALRSPDLSARTGLCILEQHPEYQFLTGGGQSWCVFAEGFAELAFSLQKDLVQQGIEFRSNQEVEQIVADGFDGYRIAYRGRDGTVERISVRDVVLAMTLPDLFRIAPELDIEAVQKHVLEMPLYKCFVRFASPWWRQHDLSGKCIFTNNHLKKVYFPLGEDYLFFYADYEAALWWQEQCELGEEVLQATIFRELCHVFDESPGPSLIREVKSQFWPRGICAWKKTTPTWLLQGLGQMKNLWIVSDAFTPHLGWVEGSLASAQEAVLGLARANDGRHYEERQTSFFGNAVHE